MALTKSISEVQEVLPQLVSSLNAQSNLPDMDAAEQKYLVPIIGNELLSDIQGKYDAATLSDSEVKLTTQLRRVSAAYAYLDSLAANHVFLTDTGVRVHSTGDMQKAAGWEYKELKKYLQEKAVDATEVLLQYLWRHKADLPHWTNSDAYKQFTGLLIRTGEDFSNQYRLYQPMRNFYALKILMRDQQDAYLLSAMGKPLLTYLIYLTSPSDAEAAIILQLKKALAYFTVKHAVDHYTIRFSDSGFTVVNEIMGGDRETEDSGRSGATPAGIQRLKDACDRDGKNFISAAKKLAITLRTETGAAADYITAFDAGPLAKKLTACEYKSGNERRKIFRF